MLFPADQVLKAANREVRQLTTLTDNPGEGSALQCLAVALRLLAIRESGGTGLMRSQIDRLSKCLASVEGLLTPPSLQAQCRALCIMIEENKGAASLGDAEAAWREVIAATQRLAANIAATSDLPQVVRGRIADLFIDWESADLSDLMPGASDDVEAAPETTHERWTAYLRDRFSEPELTVTAFRALAGGFGKQTYLFDVSGKALNGSYILRRDLAIALIGNDCHRIEKEFELIRAVHARGFPAPEALWLDTEHRLLPGGHFLVMRCAAGVAGGTVFEPNSLVPQDLAQTLAELLARLHTMRGLEDFGHLTEMIRPELVNRPLRDVVGTYLTDWRGLFAREAHLPSPAIMALFGWLLDHVPVSDGHPVLLHGDIGFHNFLFDDGRLTAVIDWEFGHLGDPAEDLAYVRNSLGEALDWAAFIRAYRAAGGPVIDERRLHFFQIWGHVRNACAANLVSAKLYARQIDDLKVIALPHLYIPRFLQATQELIRSYEQLSSR
ncbi:hypothetical protein AWC29_26445 [Mycobacterium triplex]|uniref:Aminoglycoside phosphotransferase n=1 Tax=Mycobacterium triplex TaxID=47839 RepID=A0A024K2J5_9MYCO|nr:phosphotransferase family protein [Mycobacterium triplex]ORW99905.1 hypothetical protein AWC29_26445 [Mycobacterium triplex]CDO90280.1 aminoglycoside phosphotransferase [Mycobacterium triplex]